MSLNQNPLAELRDLAKQAKQITRKMSITGRNLNRLAHQHGDVVNIVRTRLSQHLAVENSRYNQLCLLENHLLATKFNISTKVPA